MARADADDSAPQPRRRDAAATRERILVAAAELFSELSFDQATTRQIASRAGVRQALLSYYFASKDELWRAAIDRIFEELTASAERLPPREDPVDRARDFIRFYVRFQAQHPELHRLMVQANRDDDERTRWLVDRYVVPGYEGLVAGIEELQELGYGAGLSPVSLYYALVGAASMMFANATACKRLAGLDPRSEEVIAEHTETLLALFTTPYARLEPSGGTARRKATNRRTPAKRTT
jgi:TetR/AcrR family transcriptional regulator